MSDQSIFRPSFGNRPDRIVGRENVIEDFARGLSRHPGSRERARLLIGQRGMGKTVLLLEMADRAHANEFVTARTTCGPSMLDNILDLLQRNGSPFVSEKRQPVKGFSAGALGFSFGLTFTDEVRESYGFRVKLEMICERLAEAEKGVLLLIDEVRPELPEMRLLATTYQELAGEGANIAVAMAGLPAIVSEVLDEATLTFLHRATKVELGPLSIPSVRAYYHSAFMRANRSLDDALLDRAAEATQGFPYLLQLLGYYLVEYCPEGEPVKPDELESAIDAALYDFDHDVLGAMLRPLSRADMTFLEAMSQDDRVSRVADLQERLGVSQGHVQSYRRRLIDAGVIYSPARGELAFIVPRLGAFIKREML